MKKEKFLGNVIGAFLLVIYGSFLLCSSLISFQNIKWIVTIFFILYSISHLVTFIFLKQKEYSSLFLCGEGILASVICVFLNITESPKHFAIFLLIFTILNAIIKLKKADYYHDRKNKIWTILVSELLFFLLLSILISINLHFETPVLIVIFGFYVFFIGVFEFLEGLLLNITKGKIK